MMFSFKISCYALIYWDENGNGSFQFPAGYKDWFMLRSVIFQDKNNGGEQWGDGRMNNEDQ